MYAARALLAFCEHGGRAPEAQFIEAYDIIRALRNEECEEEARKLYALFEEL